MFEDLILEYMKREPLGTDSWNPLNNELELWHRVRLFLSLNWALDQLPIPIAEMKILDVGCGVGRSTRILLEFGAKPENIMGIDLRASAIAYAKSINPAISFQTVNGFDDWPPIGTFDLCIQCVVFSSIKSSEKRLALARMMESMVVENGFVFWWDGLRANLFAGADLLDPSALFKDCQVLNSCLLPLHPTLVEALSDSGKNIIARIFPALQGFLGYQPTHCAALLKKSASAKK